MILNRENTIYSLKNNKIEDHFGIIIEELSFINKINLRINPNDNNHMSSCGKILGVILPHKPNTYVQNKKVKVIWLCPNEWLVINNIENDLFIKLKNELGDVKASITDISENKKIIKELQDLINQLQDLIHH